MDSSPRNIRFRQDALAAIKILRQEAADKSNSEIVSDALVRAANNHVAAPILQFARLDPADYLGIHAAIAEIAQQHQRLKKDLLKIRPADKDAAGKLAKAIDKADAEIAALLELRQRLAKIARATADITPEDATMLIEQVAPNCRNDLADSQTPEYVARKNRAILNLIKTVFPEAEND